MHEFWGHLHPRPPYLNVGEVRECTKSTNIGTGGVGGEQKQLYVQYMYVLNTCPESSDFASPIYELSHTVPLSGGGPLCSPIVLGCRW